MEESEEDRRRRKLEEALEIQSLRRIISAYLKYIPFHLFNFFNQLEENDPNINDICMWSNFTKMNEFF